MQSSQPRREIAALTRGARSADKGSNMLSAITPVQVKEVIRLVEQWSDARKARADESQKQFPDEIIHDPERRKLTDYLYALSDEGRGELIALMLLG